MRFSKFHLYFSSILITLVTVTTALGVYAKVAGIETPSIHPRSTPNERTDIHSNSPESANAGVLSPTNTRAASTGETGEPITTSSGISEMRLALRLKNIGAKMYGAYWCPHCHQQKQLFGQEAIRFINYIECDPKGNNAQPELCRAANIQGYPTWEINGEFYPGTQSLEELAELSGYEGDRIFKNQELGR